MSAARFPFSCTLLFLWLTFFPQAGRAVLKTRPESARPFGMGSAFSAVANDYNAVLFNPAGLKTVRQIETAGTLGRSLFEGTPPGNEASAVGVFPLRLYKQEWDYGVAGFQAHRSARQGEGGVTEVGAAFGFHPNQILPDRFGALPIPENFSAGLTLRGRELQRYGASAVESHLGLSADLGVLYQFAEGDKLIASGWSVAAVIQEMNMPGLGASAGYRLGGSWRNPYSVLAMDVLFEEGVTRFFPGIESSFFRKILFLRLGTAETPGEPRQIVLGLGTLLPPIQMDVAYGFPTGDPARVNERLVFSFTYRFGSPFLSQYLYQERLEKIGEVENSVANLEAKRDALKGEVRESRELYEAISADVERMKAKSGEEKKKLVEMEELAAGKNRAIEKLQEEIDRLGARKGKIERRLREEAEPRIEVRPPGSPGGARKHKAAAGDTLRGLAQKYYGDPNLWQVIYEANPDKVLRGVPREGEVLTIP